ncbi:MAG: hypothetical protein IJB33_04815 [Akkermansia sp.]|nr:hypothetical protein [Akkermansia sp.]
MIRRFLSLFLLCSAWSGAEEREEVLPGVYMHNELVPRREDCHCFLPFFDASRFAFLADSQLDVVIFDIEQGEGKPPVRHRLKVKDLRPAEYGGKEASANDRQLMKRYFGGERRAIRRQWDAEAGILYSAREVNSKIGKYWLASLTRIRSDMWRRIIAADDCKVIELTNLKPWLFTYCYFDGGNIGPGMEEHIIIQDVRVNPQTGAYEGTRNIVYNYRTLEKVEDTLHFFHPDEEDATAVKERNEAALRALLADPDTLEARVFVWFPNEWRGVEYPVAVDNMPRLREILRHMQVNPECWNKTPSFFPANRYLLLCLKNEQGCVQLRLHPDRITTPRKAPIDKSAAFDWEKENERRNYPFLLPDEELRRELVEIVERTLPAEVNCERTVK